MLATPSQVKGYRAHASGLMVPEAISRQRQVWAKDEFKALDKAIRLLDQHQVTLQLKCGADACTDRVLTRVTNSDGGYTLRCGCTDRIFQRAF